MKKTALACCLMLCISGSGCVLHSKAGKSSFDGLSGEYALDAQDLARRTADELGERYAPGHTTLALDRAPGFFGEALEADLRSKGFALSAPDASSLGVSYTLDALHEGASAQGYVQVRCTDGQLFSLTRTLGAKTDRPFVTEPPLTEPLPQDKPLASRPLPESPVAAPDNNLRVRAHPVRSKASAAAVARRSGVPVADFCRWNEVEPTTVLPKGKIVYLSEPPATAEKPVTASLPAPSGPLAPVASLPAPTNQPAPHQTSPAPALPKATEPVSPSPAAPPVTPPVAAPAAVPVAASVPAAAPEKTDLPSEPVVIETLPAASPLPQWEISRGKMLRSLMEGWTAVAGYTLIWRANHDYEMQSSSTFFGDFVSAVKSFFAALQANGIALRVTIYQGNKVMEVSEH